MKFTPTSDSKPLMFLYTVDEMIVIFFIFKFDAKVIWYNGKYNQSVDMVPQAWCRCDFIVPIGCQVLLEKFVG